MFVLLNLRFMFANYLKPRLKVSQQIRKITCYSKFFSFLQASLKRSQLELEAELRARLDKIDMLTQSAQIKDNIIKVGR